MENGDIKMTFVKQVARPGLYVSDVIGGRFQVLESDVFKGSYIVYDGTKDDISRTKDGSTQYFDTLESATAVAEGLTPSQVVKTKREPKAPKEPKAAKPVKDPAVKVPTEPKTRKPSANGMIIELIKTTKLSDDEISVKVLEVFADCKTAKPYDVKYRRRKVEAGEL
jgi:hypothetical protein